MILHTYGLPVYASPGMAAELITPRDPEFGLPLPIAPSEDGPLPHEALEANWHHHWHPESHPVLQNLGGLALRHSRVQLVDPAYHNMGTRAYHRYYAGPVIPESPEEQFREVVLACAGLIPAKGLDMSGDEPREVWLSPRQVEILHTRDDRLPFDYRYFRYSYNEVREFLTDYVLSQELMHVRLGDIDEFLHTRRESVKRKLGEKLLREQVNTATQAVCPDYKRAFREGLLHPLMPRGPQPLVRYKLQGRQGVEEAVFPRLEIRLRAAVQY